MMFDVTHIYKSNGAIRMGSTLMVSAINVHEAHLQAIETLGEPFFSYRELDEQTISNGVNTFHAQEIK